MAGEIPEKHVKVLFEEIYVRNDNGGIVAKFALSHIWHKNSFRTKGRYLLLRSLPNGQFSAEDK